MLLGNYDAKNFSNDETKLSSVLMNRTGKMSGLKGSLKHDEPMTSHTSWRTGGVVDEYFEPTDLDDLCKYLVGLPDNRQILWLGLGSNLLVRDGGFNGSVIAYAKALNRIEMVKDGVFHIEAGVPCAKVARFTAKSGYTGGEFLAGIPGTIGGALAMNAGAFGSETWNIVNKVQTINRAGTLRERARNEFVVDYRSVITPGEEWFVSAEIELATDPGKTAERRIRELLDKRSESQPTGLPSCGSVFRNPAGDYAGRLIEHCGLKGKKIGGAIISEKHGNFIINTGDATSEDIENLILLAQKTVQELCNVTLVPEVKIVGNK